MLIIEHNAVSRELMRDLLAFHGYRTLEAATALDGVSMAAEELPDLIVMDVQLPGLDGVSALALLRSDPLTANIPVVALTAYALQSEQLRFERAGFDKCITKPIDIKDFSNPIRDICDRHHLRA